MGNLLDRALLVASASIVSFSLYSSVQVIILTGQVITPENVHKMFSR